MYISYISALTGSRPVFPSQLLADYMKESKTTKQYHVDL